MTEENNNPGDASFNQAYFQQQRLNNLFSRIDMLSTAPLQKNGMGEHNYQVIFRDLISCLLTISAKLNQEEKDMMRDKRMKITNILNNSPPHKRVSDWRGKVVNFTCLDAWMPLNELYLDFRDSLEILMEKYGFGNPDKEKEGGFD